MTPRQFLDSLTKEELADAIRDYSGFNKAENQPEKHEEQMATKEVKLYRFLEEGEVKQKGDEAYNEFDGKWRITSDVGGIVLAEGVGKYRRLVRTETVEEPKPEPPKWVPKYKIGDKVFDGLYTVKNVDADGECLHYLIRSDATQFWLPKELVEYEPPKPEQCSCHVKKTDVPGMVLMFPKKQCPVHGKYSEVSVRENNLAKPD